MFLQFLGREEGKMIIVNEMEGEMEGKRRVQEKEKRRKRERGTEAGGKNCTQDTYCCLFLPKRYLSRTSGSTVKRFNAVAPAAQV